MYNRFKLLAATLALGTFCVPASASAEPALRHDDMIHVLFIGNSLTYYNEMPETFRRVVEAAEPGKPSDMTKARPSGVTIFRGRLPSPSPVGVETRSKVFKFGARRGGTLNPLQLNEGGLVLCRIFLHDE
jgi:hypothetical protein